MKTSARLDIKAQSFLSQTLDFVREHNLLPEKRELLLSVSGGPDSMALLPLALELKKLRPNLLVKVLYIHHQTRDAQAQEEKFVSHWSGVFGFEFVSEYIKNWEGDTSNFEARARMQRKDLLSRHAHKSVIFTGHHLDDSYEWSLMQSSRTAQLRPRGIPLINGLYRRPWLCAQKKQILRFLSAYGLPYLRDPTNFDEGVHERNDVRHQVVSPLKLLYPKLLKNYVHRQNTLALLDGVHVNKGHEAKVRHWERGVSLYAKDWDKSNDPLRVEQLVTEIKSLGPSGRGELCVELYKILSALRAGAKGPHRVTRGLHLYLWGKEIFILKAEDLQYYEARDGEVVKLLKKGSQIPEDVPMKILPNKKGSLKAPHPLFPKSSDVLKRQQLGWQTPARALFMNEP